MKTGKRTLAILLCALLLVGIVPFGAYAQDGADAEVTAKNDYQLASTNSLGMMLRDVMDEETTPENDSYYISDLTMSDATATVSYYSESDAELIVAAYDEATMRMLSSAQTAITASETTAEVTLDHLTAKNMVIKAFMLDENHAALCKNYTCNDYTKAYQDFLAKTVSDFDADKVINLDNASDNNFLVLADDVAKATETGTGNALLSADYDNGVYVFGNAGTAITALQKGELFYYNDKDMENIVVIVVEAVSVDETGTATVWGETVALEDAFQHVRIDTSASEENFELDPSTVGEGVTYTDENGGANNAPRKAGDFNAKTTLSKEFKLEKKRTNGYDPGEDDGTAGFYMTGSGKLTIEAKFKVFISKDVKEVSFTLAPEFRLSFSVQAKAELINFELGTFTVSPVYGVFISISPTLVFKPSVKISTAVSVKTTVGFGFDLKNGFVNKCEKPSITFDGIQIEGTFFIGLDLNPHAYLICKELVEADMTGELGFEIKASTQWFENTWFKETEQHLCTNCIGGDVKLKFNLGIDLTFLEGSKLESKFHHDFLNLTFDICQFYWSITFGDHGLGKCPHTQSAASPGASDGVGSADDLSNGGTQGGIIQFGAYPQTKVTDSATISALNSRASGWQTYGYYSGSGSVADGQMTAKDYMQYCDVKYGGSKYRGVKFDAYRPRYTGGTSSASYTYQDDNGYTTGTTYWFQYEPLQWKVLDPSEGLVMCVSLIDSQPYNNYILSSGTVSDGTTAYWGDAGKTHYVNDYANSSLHDWLNETFYATAFTEVQQNRILVNRNQNNDGYYTLTGNTNYTDYDSDPTNDKIFLLSYADVINSAYGFSSSKSAYDTARQAKGTDYAKCQGLWVNSSGSYQGNSKWWLRSPGSGSYTACIVSYYGKAGSSIGASDPDGGIRPACKISNLASGISKSGNLNPKAAPAAKAEENGTGSYRYSYTACVAGNDYILLNVTGYGSDFTLATGNLEYIDQLTADENGKVSGTFLPRNAVSGSTTLLIGDFGSGTEARQLTVTEQTQPQEHTHTYTSAVTTRPTCTTKGVRTYTCTSCEAGTEGHTYTEAINALGHAYVNHAAKAPTCTEPGWEAYQTCSRCSYTTFAEKAALGHTDDNNDGKCDRCNTQLDNNQPQDNVCRYCGETHTGLFGWLIGLIHNLLALFGLRK